MKALHILSGRHKGETSQRDAEVEEGREAERNTISILGSIASLERRSAQNPVVLATALTERCTEGSEPLTNSPAQKQTCPRIVGVPRGPGSSATHSQQEPRTVAEVFSDRAPSLIDMSLLWTMQAEHYREFASRLHDGEASPQEVVPHRTGRNADSVIGPGKDAQVTSQCGSGAHQGKLEVENFALASGGDDITEDPNHPARQGGEKREGPSRKSLRRAKKRMLQVGEGPKSSGREVDAGVPDLCGPTTTQTGNTMEDSRGVPKCWQAEGPGPPGVRESKRQPSNVSLWERMEFLLGE